MDTDLTPMPIDVEMLFSCQTSPRTELSPTSVGRFTLSITSLPTQGQRLVVRYTENDERYRPGMSVTFGWNISPSGEARLGRFAEVKQVVRTFQGLVSMAVDLDVDFRDVELRAADMVLNLHPHARGDDLRAAPSQAVLEEFLQLVPAMSEHETALCFFRLGWNAIDSGTPLEAYYYFWFFVERTFAAGKWRTEELVQQLLSSATLVAAIERVRTEWTGNSAGRPDAAAVAALVGNSAQDVIRRLVVLRGDLHHAKPTSTWHPGELDSIRLETAFLGTVCQRCMGFLAGKL